MRIEKIERTFDSIGQVALTLHISTRYVRELSSLALPLDVTFSKPKKKRSLSANSFLWVLCDKIAKVIQSTKEDVYRFAVREVGVYVPATLQRGAVDKWRQIWQTKGIGWFCDVLDDEDGCNYVDVMNYYGSSSYDTEEMSRLLQYIVDEAQELGIDTLTPNDRSLLIERWKAEHGSEIH
jgi:hypothetical protein